MDRMISNISVLRNNSIYRIGDVLYQKGFKWKHDIQQIKLNINNQWSSTLLYKYFNLANDDIVYNSKYLFDIKLFNKIIDEYIDKTDNVLLPSHNELVIYIRSGDTMIDDRDQNNRMNTKHWYSSHLEFIPLINNTLIKYRNINQITFVTALHFGNYIENTDQFIYTKLKEDINKITLKRLFKTIYGLFPNLSYKLISNQDTDKDLIYLSRAKYMILDYSGFGEVIKQLNQNCNVCLCIRETPVCKD